MGISDRINAWVEDRRTVWGGALGNFLLGTLSKGAVKFLEDAEPGVKEAMHDTLTRIRDYPNTPPEIKKALDDALATADWEKTLSGWIWYLLGIIPAIMQSGTSFANEIRYDVELLTRTFRLDPVTLTSIWLRDKPAYEKYFQDLRQQGWSDDRLDVLKELAKIIPPLADMVRFADFSAFDPEVIEKWRQFYDAPGWIIDPMSLIGITNEAPRDWANKYWFSHYIQPGRFELGEMYRRGLLGKPLVGQEEITGQKVEGEAEETIKLAYRTMAYSTFWQDRLLQLVREVPTRVDVRRWWDMRTIDETELREIYQRQGYFGKDLENYVLWTKVYVAFPDLMSRWSNGWITEAEVRSELTELGMRADRVEEMIQTKIKAGQPERTAKERDITKTDIYKGVKQGIITRGEAIELLMDLGFNDDEADYLLSINIPPDEEDVVVRQRELTKTDIIKGLKAEIITEAEARTRLIGLRYSATDADFLLDIFKATITPPTETREREASKSDIILAVKKGLIIPEEAYLMLQDIGFTPAASEFILSVRAETSPFSPVSFTEFKDITQKWRKATGMDAKPMPEELKKAADELLTLSKEVEALNLAIEEERGGLLEDEELPSPATQRLKELQVTRNRAQSELERVKSQYNSLIAEWKHKFP